MIGLTVEIEHCPDGIELVDLPEVEDGSFALGVVVSYAARTVFRYRSNRIEPKDLTVESLENSVLMQFANAADDKRRLRFFKRFGLLDAPLLRRDGMWEIRRDVVLKAQSVLRGNLLGGLNQFEPDRRMQAINLILRNNPQCNFHPIFHLAEPRRDPQLLLKSGTLFGFMLLEMAMIVAHGVRVAECDKCKNVFLTGPFTGHRSSARFCSDKCRVAAMRARKAM